MMRKLLFAAAGLLFLTLPAHAAVDCTANLCAGTTTELTAAYDASDTAHTLGNAVETYSTDDECYLTGDGTTAWGTLEAAGKCIGAGSGLSNVVEDTTPQLGGDLDLNGHVITGLVPGTDIQAVLSEGAFADGDKDKLDGIAAGAEVNRALASQAEAEAGTENTKGMTPLRTAEAIAALAAGSGLTIVDAHTGSGALVLSTNSMQTSTGTPISVTLPPAGASAWQLVFFNQTGSTANVARDGSDTINGGTTIAVPPDSVGWFFKYGADTDVKALVFNDAGESNTLSDRGDAVSLVGLKSGTDNGIYNLDSPTGTIDITRNDTDKNVELEVLSSPTSTIDGGNWKVLYTDGSGDATELALGADGTYLKSNGASSAPTFATPSGSGDALTTNPLSQFAATTSAQLYGVLSDETGSATGTPLAVFNQAPQIDNIELGAASDTTLARSAAGRITVETKRLSYLGTTTTESATSHTLAAGDDVLFLSWTNTDAKTYTIATGTAAANDEWTGCNNGGTGDLTVVQGSGMTLIGNLIFHPGECYMIKFTSTTTANVIGGATS